MATPRRSSVIAALAAITSALIWVGPTDGISKASTKKTPASEPPMRVYLVRSAQNGCEPNCPEWIAAQGHIVAGTLTRFKKVFREAGKRQLPVLIHSGGGLADEALAIGYLLRAKGLDVAVARTVFTPCAPEAPACRKQHGRKLLRGSPDRGFSICASACAFVLAAGRRRFVRPPAFVGVHRGEMVRMKVLHTYRMTPYRGGDGSIRYKKVLISKKIASQKHMDPPEKIYQSYKQYFIKMGIDKKIMPLLLATPNNSIHWLTGEELRSTGMATHRMSGEQLVLGAAEPGDGWTRPAITAGPIGSMRRDPSVDCAVSVMNCAWQFKPDPSGASSSDTAVSPIILGPALAPSAAQDCARFGLGCSWQLTPTAPVDGPGASSTPPR